MLTQKETKELQKEFKKVIEGYASLNNLYDYFCEKEIYLERFWVKAYLTTKQINFYDSDLDYSGFIILRKNEEEQEFVQCITSLMCMEALNEEVQKKAGVWFGNFLTIESYEFRTSLTRH